jgi:hypothetical protein
LALIVFQINGDDVGLNKNNPTVYDSRWWVELDSVWELANSNPEKCL